MDPFTGEHLVRVHYLSQSVSDLATYVRAGGKGLACKSTTLTRPTKNLVHRDDSVTVAILVLTWTWQQEPQRHVAGQSRGLDLPGDTSTTNEEQRREEGARSDLLAG